MESSLIIPFYLESLISPRCTLCTLPDNRHATDEYAKKNGTGGLLRNTYGSVIIHEITDLTATLRRIGFL